MWALCTVFSIKSPRKETCGHAALFRDFLSLADRIFVVIGPLLHWRDCLCSVSEYTSFEPDRLLSRLECFAHWQSRQSPPDGAGSVHTIYITMEPCSRTISPLHGIVSSWSHNSCAVCPSEIFTLPQTSSYAPNRIISDKLRSDWKTRKVVGTHAKGCARSLAEEWKVVASVVEWLMPGNCMSAA